MVIAALVSFGALLIGWLLAPAERRAPVAVDEPAPMEALPRAA